jgi:hypothetical protein
MKDGDWQIAYVMPTYKWPNKDAAVTCSIITLVRGYNWKIQGIVDPTSDITPVRSWDDLVRTVSPGLREGSSRRSWERTRAIVEASERRKREAQEAV